MTAVHEAKVALRKELKQRLAAMTDDDRNKQSTIIAKQVMSFFLNSVLVLVHYQVFFFSIRELYPLYHTIPTPRKKPFENIVEKGENAGNGHFSPFQQYFPT